MIGLLDVNVLIALFDAAHVHHEPAHVWLRANRSQGWASCPITQNGCIRVMSQPNYPGRLPVTEILRRLRASTGTREHRFWPDAISLCEAERFEPNRILIPKFLTDVYLLALAVENGGRLVTFDRNIPRAAVPAAKSRHLVIL